jgi:hypothetical protein
MEPKKSRVYQDVVLRKPTTLVMEHVIHGSLTTQKHVVLISAIVAMIHATKTPRMDVIPKKVLTMVLLDSFALINEVAQLLWT